MALLPTTTEGNETGFDQGSPGSPGSWGAKAGGAVLVAEGDEARVAYFSGVLEGQGYRVTRATSGRAALKEHLEQPFDLILMPETLPDFEGPSLAQMLRTVSPQSGSLTRPEEARAPVPILALSPDPKALAKDPDRRTAFDGALDISKGAGDWLAEVARATDPALRREGPWYRALLEEAASFSFFGEAPLEKVMDEARAGGFIAPDPGLFASAPSGMFDPAPEAEHPVATAPAEGAALSSRSGIGDGELLFIDHDFSPERVAALFTEPGAALRAVIDLTGDYSFTADITQERCLSMSAEDLFRYSALIAERRDKIHPRFQDTEDLDDLLLAHLFIANKELIPRLVAESRVISAYNVFLDGEVVAAAADRLAAKGLLQAKFVDRAQVCGTCGSSRFNVREICGKCGSADLSEQPFIHHYTCGYTGPEADFKVGRGLECPKCSKALTHYGQDYDKPGLQLTCGACGHSQEEADVGLRCLDCGTEHRGDEVATREISRYRLTAAGKSYLTSGGQAALTHQQSAGPLSLPPQLTEDLSAALRSLSQSGRPFALYEITYAHGARITARHGAGHFRRARDVFLEGLQGGLSPDMMIYRAESTDYLLAPQPGDTHSTGPTGPNGAEQSLVARLPALVRNSTSALSVDLGVRMLAYHPGDIDLLEAG